MVTPELKDSTPQPLEGDFARQREGRVQTPGGVSMATSRRDLPKAAMFVVCAITFPPGFGDTLLGNSSPGGGCVICVWRLIV